MELTHFLLATGFTKCVQRLSKTSIHWRMCNSEASWVTQLY